jgi:DNA polymerase-3 subunit gamma/tau
MTYLALARKWRPQTFAQLVGQEHITKPLINALTQERIHHAYLFTGTRGVGKTSIARILAKALNCELGITATPCLQCSHCIAIEKNCFIDLFEIDGASKTRVEDTRELIENIQYLPTQGRYKIYLIDEVHMLSQHSFNALLKTLEEPPSHVKFLLATTDPQKLPVTVLSRCLQFNLRQLPTELIKQHLKFILSSEHLEVEEEALSILGYAAQGSMRDSLSLLDQVITSVSEILLAKDVKSLLGYTQKNYALQLLDALAVGNAALLLSLSQEIAAEGGQFQYILDELLNYFHYLSLYQCLGTDAVLDTPVAELKNYASKFIAEDLQLFYQICLKGKEEMQIAPTLAIGFNMILIRMLTFKPAPLISSIPLMPLMTEEANTPVLLNNDPAPAMVEGIIVEPVIEKIPPMSPPSSVVTEIAATWSDVIPQLKLTGLALSALENAEFVSKEGQNISLKVATGHQSLFTPSTLNRIEEALGHYYQCSIKINLHSAEQVDDSPARQKEVLMKSKQQEAEAAISEDSVFQHIKKEFSAELVKNSIVSLKNDL